MPGRGQDGRQGATSTRDFDARRVLGLSLDDAEKLGTAHRCNVRATTIDGKSLALTMDLRFDRVDVIVEHGKVTRFDTHNGPVG